MLFDLAHAGVCFSSCILGSKVLWKNWVLRLVLVLDLVVSAAVTFWLNDEVALVCSDRVAETRDDKSV